MRQVILGSVFLGLIVSACGLQSERAQESGSASSIIGDVELTKESVNANLSEAIESLADTNLNKSSGSLNLWGLEVNLGGKKEKTCTAQGATAVETVVATIKNDFSFEGLKRSISSKREGSSTLTRTWSKTGGTVACKNGKRADIDFEADITGMQMALSFDRSLSRSLEITKKSKDDEQSKEASKASAPGTQNNGAGLLADTPAGTPPADQTPSTTTGTTPTTPSASTETKKTKAMSFTAKGSRNVSWDAQTSNADGSITRKKTITGSVTRTHSRTDSNGVQQNLSFTIDIATATPLKVQVTYGDLSHERDIKTKLIESGTITATRAGDGKIVSTFDNFQLDFSDDCLPVSGKMKSEFFAEGGTTAAKTYELEAKDGDYTLKDVTDPANPKNVDELDFDVCAISEFKD